MPETQSPSTTAAQSQQPPAPELDEQLVEAMLAHALAHLKFELPDEDLPKLRQSVEANLRNAAILRRYPLTNADEPDYIFRPYRAEG
jgi:hypothetical protein